MQIRPYREIELELEFYNQAEEIIDRLKPVLIEKYGNHKYRESLLAGPSHQLTRIIAVSNGTLEEKTILDLGCGSSNSLDSLTASRSFEPWLMRVLYEEGIDAIGIDIASLEEEEFKYYRKDLLDQEVLDVLPDHSIDVANLSFLFDSPSMLSNALGTMFYTKSSRKQAAMRLYETLVSALERVVKPEGIFIYEDRDVGIQLCRTP